MKIKRFKDIDNISENIINEKMNNELIATIKISKELVKVCKNYGVIENYTIIKVIEAYIEDMIGYPFGMDYDHFSTWAENNNDTIDDIKLENNEELLDDDDDN